MANKRLVGASGLWILSIAFLAASVAAGWRTLERSMSASGLYGTIYVDEFHKTARSANSWLIVAIILFGVCVALVIAALKGPRKSGD
jgi:CelD/BcsL family acetyltransferase involved in cellulose biosynthesis